LLKLREVTSRSVLPFLMQYRVASAPSRFTEYDLMVLPKLLASPLMEDCRASLLLLKNAGTSGDFEQESLGPPTMSSWPFFSVFNQTQIANFAELPDFTHDGK